MNQWVNGSSCRESKFVVLNTKQQNKNRDEEKKRQLSDFLSQ